MRGGERGKERKGGAELSFIRVVAAAVGILALWRNLDTPFSFQASRLDNSKDRECSGRRRRG